MKFKEPIEVHDVLWQEPIVNPKPVFEPEDKPVPIWGPVKPIPVEPVRDPEVIIFKEPGDGPEVILKEPTDDPLLDGGGWDGIEPTDDFEDPILDGSKGSNSRWL